ncbi:mcmbp [Symbiodinium sp. CCMP2592]|nr:mcmbp [Symbiodinium sp. CCMP2592]|mmetsp:Transcript_146165/g.207202  ORF Transcript_146165/g.207202 Transcript_146165/m.207202 type:complete len:187 (+) Transcript_146165:51-611(+)
MGQSCCRAAAPCEEVPNQVLHETTEACDSEAESLLRELFRLHDLNSNGLLEIEELVQLNSKVALLHRGRDVNLLAVKARYRKLFKERLDPEGHPVKFETFRKYVIQVLDGIDRDPIAQEMMLEQFVAEAKSARAVFHAPSFASHADKAFLPHLSFHVNSFPRTPDKTGHEASRKLPIQVAAACGGA